MPWRWPASTDPEQALKADQAQTQSSRAPQSRSYRSRSSPSTEPQEQKLDLARRQPNDPMARGQVDALIVLVKFSDYRCQFCVKWAGDTQPALMKYVKDGRLRIELHDIPVFGEESTQAAIAVWTGANRTNTGSTATLYLSTPHPRVNRNLPKRKLVKYAEQVAELDIA